MLKTRPLADFVLGLALALTLAIPSDAARIEQKSGGGGAASDVSCTDCLNATEIEDIYVLNSGDTMTGALVVDGSADTPQGLFQCNATQTTNCFEIEDSAAANLFTISGTGVPDSASYFHFDDTDLGTYVGFQAGNAGPSGNDNSFFGYQAGAAITTGSDNTAMGYLALTTDTNIAQSTAFGSQALELNDGNFNTAVGYQAIEASSTGSSNTAVGWQAMQNAGAAANNNTAVGASALDAAMTGDQNAALGMRALGGVTSGGDNMGVGYQAGLSISTGSDNMAIGSNSMLRNATGSQNSAVGSNALFGVAGNNHSNNTSVGYQSAFTITTGSNNTFLGHTAGDQITTGSNNIVIGYDIDVPTATSSNTLNIGNLLFGTGIDGADTTISSGNIGIGVVTPTFFLGLSGEAARTIGMERELTAATAGNNLTVSAGGAVSGGTNLAGGDSILASGTATGNGESKVQISTVNSGQGTGTTDRTAAVVAQFDEGRLEFLDTAPTVSSCGGGTPAVTADSTDHAGTVTVGTGVVTSCTITFSLPAWTNTPRCVANNQTQLLLVRATPTTTTVVLDAAVTFDEDVIDWLCFSNE